MLYIFIIQNTLKAFTYKMTHVNSEFAVNVENIENFVHNGIKDFQCVLLF